MFGTLDRLGLFGRQPGGLGWTEHIERLLASMMQTAILENNFFDHYERTARAGLSLQSCIMHPFAERNQVIGNRLQDMLDSVERLNTMDGGGSRAEIDGVVNQIFEFQNQREERYQRLVHGRMVLVVVSDAFGQHFINRFGSVFPSLNYLGKGARVGSKG